MIRVGYRGLPLMPDARRDKLFVRRCYGRIRIRTRGEAT